MDWAIPLPHPQNQNQIPSLFEADKRGFSYKIHLLRLYVGGRRVNFPIMFTKHFDILAWKAPSKCNG